MHNPVIEEISLDANFFEIVGAVEAEEADQADLIRHVNANHFKLTETLDRLTKRSRKRASYGSKLDRAFYVGLFWACFGFWDVKMTLRLLRLRSKNFLT